MKAYLLTTGALFALLALAHLARSIVESAQFASNPWFILEGPGIGLIAAAIAIWAWRLLRTAADGAAGL
jgi:hypothetical protein